MRCRGSWAPFLLVLFFSLLRFAQLDGPITNDEAYTFNFATKSIESIRQTYHTVNNHMLLSVLLYAVNSFGEDWVVYSPSGVKPFQLISITVSIATLILLYFFAKRLLGRRGALIALACFGVSYWHLVYSAMVRAYGLSTLLVLLSALCVHRVQESRRPVEAGVLALVLTAANAAHPFNGFYGAALLAWAMSPRLFGKRPEWRLIVGSFTAALVMTLIFYSPVMSQLLSGADSGAKVSWSQTLPATGKRLFESVRVLGGSVGVRAFVLILAGIGLGRAWKKKHPFAPLFTLLLAIPLILLTLQRGVPFGRLFLPMLPFWAMAFAQGVLFTIGMLPSRSRRKALLPALATTLLVSSADAWAFATWQKGLDLRRPLNKIALLARQQDDFSVVIPPRVRHPVIGQSIEWEYYAHCLRLTPDHEVLEKHDHPFLIRRHAYFIAENEEALEAMFEGGRVDSFLRKTVREIDRIGSFRIYHVELNEEVVRAYKRAVDDPASPVEERAAAWIGLGAEAMKRYRAKEAVQYLRNAVELGPSDSKARFLLGMAHFLAFDDSAAELEFSWVVVHDPNNPYAAFYLAQAAAAQGKSRLAKGGFKRYNRKGKFPGVWLAPRARAGFLSLDPTKRQELPPESRAFPWMRRAWDYKQRGDHDREILALREAVKAVPNPNRRVLLAQAHSHVRDFYRTIDLLENTPGLERDLDALFLKAEALRMKFRLEESRRLLENLDALMPGEGRIEEKLKEVRRMSEIPSGN